MDLYLKEEVKTEDGENYAESVGAQFLEFSAKTESPSKFDDFLIKLIDEYLIFKKGKTSDGKIALTRESILAKKKKKDCC